MHSNYLLMALSAVGAMAAPLEKREIVTEMDYVTKVVVVTATATANPQVSPDNVVVVTKTVGPNGGAPHHGGHHSHHHAQQPSVYTTVVQPSPSETPTYTAPLYSTTEAAPTTTKAPAPAPTLDSYSKKVVFHHNIHRFNHSAPAIAWDQGLADTAQKIASSCYYAHNTDEDGGGYGQNIAAGTPPDNIASVVTDQFYNGEVEAFANYYGEENPPDFEVWGHFSQVVWKGTTHVGCFTQHCPGGLSADTPLYNVPPYFTVCNYKEVGNMGGEYGNNVLPPLGWSSVGADYSGPAHLG